MTPQSSDKPLVSVIMPVYNGAKHISQSIDCILGQSYRNFELIIVNDGSTDETLSLITPPELSDNKIVIINKKHNEGVSAARNDAICSARGQYILFQDSDDLMHKDLLEQLVRPLMENPSCGMSVCGHSVFSDETTSMDFSPLGEKISQPMLLDSADYAFRATRFNPIGRMYVANVIRKNHLSYDGKLSQGEDYDFCLRYLLKCEKVFLVPQVLAYYRKHQNNSSALIEQGIGGFRITASCLGIYNNIQRTIPREWSRERRVIFTKALVLLLFKAWTWLNPLYLLNRIPFRNRARRYFFLCLISLVLRSRSRTVYRYSRQLFEQYRSKVL